MASQSIQLSGKFICLTCSKKFHVKPSYALKGWGKFCVRSCYTAYQKTLKGQQTNNWIGDKIKYSGIHLWLTNTYGSPQQCEQCLIRGKKTGRKWSIEWALLKGKSYLRRRENFWALCVKCHANYDGRKPNKTSFKKGMIPWNKGKSTWTVEYRKQYFHDYYLNRKEKQ